MAELILSEAGGQALYRVYVQPGQEYLLYGKVLTGDAPACYAIREVNVSGQVLSNTEISISDTSGLHEFSRVFTSSNAAILIIIALTGAEILELSLDGPQGIVYVTSPVLNRLKHISQFGVLVSYLDLAFEVKISSKLNGDNRLTFNLPLDDDKGQEIVNESFIECCGQKYTVKSIKDDDVLKTKTIEAEHIGLGLIDYLLHDTLDLPSVSAVAALEAILAGTPYTVGTVDVTGVNDLEIKICNKLKAVKTVQELWGGELYFDNYEVNLVQQMGQDNGVQFRKGKNLDEIIRTIDTNTLTTKMFGYGKDNLVITGLDTTGWTEDQKAGLQISEDGKITAPYLSSQFIDNYAREYQGEYRNSDLEDRQELLDAMRQVLTEREVPRVTYETEIVNLSGLAQYVGEVFGLGDTVKVIDEGLGIDVKARIVEYEQYSFEPWRDRAVLANFTQNLHDYLAGLEAMKETYDKAFSKGKVSTAWLEGIINVLRNSLIAETANVTITDTDGILIVNGDGTKALQLKGGIFGIANSKTGGSWNWRAFGTGDGFTADCIVSGKILTSLVEIVGEAVNGVNKFYWDSAGLYAVDPDNANRYMKFSKEGLRGYVDGVLRLHLGPYAADKFGLKLVAPDGFTVILDEDGILQTWQEGRADNVDASHPLALNIYLPAETKVVNKALLRFRLQAFRAYETGAASSGGSTQTSSTKDTVVKTTYHDWTNWWILIPQYWLLPDFMDYAGGHSHGGYTGYESSHNHGISSGTKLAVDGGGSVEWVPSGGHDHSIGWDGGHAHSMYSVNHDHGVDIPGHNHTVNIPSHTHSIDYGIYTDTAAAGVTVAVNGIDRTGALGGPFNSDQDSLNIAPYLSVGQWNTVQIGSSRLGRIDSTVFIQAKMGV